MAQCTLVTAYYAIPSKFSKETYLQWAYRFFQLDAPILLFTSPDLADTFRTMRGSKQLHMILTELTELEAWKKYENLWKEHKQKDHEKNHTPELYALWSQKSFFVREAIRQNPFYTPYFFWCDIGAFRTDLLPQIKDTFPQTRYLSSDRVLFSSIEPLQKGDTRIQEGIPGNFTHTNRIVGGLWGGSIFACIRWHEAYVKMVEQYFRVGRFAGKDQSVMLSAYLNNPSLGLVVKPTLSDIDPWFFLTHLLSNLPVRYQLDPTYLSPRMPPLITTTLQGGLCNQMFQIVVAYAHARRLSGTLRIRRHKLYDDKRPLYWDSIFRLFSPYVCDSFPKLPEFTDPQSTCYYELPKQSCHLYGYFQSPRYFEEYSQEIRQLLAPSPATLQKIKEKYSFLLEKKDRIVVVHARRTDYCEKADFHGPLTIDYYQKALERMKVENPYFLLCSDDVNYWKNQNKLFEHRDHYLLEGEDDVTTLALFSNFFYFIIANSTFSWWGAWMAEAKHVIAPSKWFGPTGVKKYEDIYVKSWERI